MSESVSLRMELKGTPLKAQIRNRTPKIYYVFVLQPEHISC